MPEFWMCLMQYIAYGHCTNLSAVIETEVYSEYSQTYKVEGAFCKKKKFFRAGEVS